MRLVALVNAKGWGNYNNKTRMVSNINQNRPGLLFLLTLASILLVGFTPG